MSLIPGKIRIMATADSAMYLLYGIDHMPAIHKLPDTPWLMCHMSEDGLAAMFGDDVFERAHELRGDDYVEVQVSATLTCDTHNPLEE